jgi:hypothetical protein
LNIDVLCTVSPWKQAQQAALARDQLEAKPHRFGKRKSLFDSPRRQLGAVSAASLYFQ